MKLAVHLPRNCSSSPDFSLTKFFSSGSSSFKGHLWPRNSPVSDFHVYYLILNSLMDVIVFFAQQTTIAKLPVRYVWTNILMVVIRNGYGLNCVLSPKLWNMSKPQDLRMWYYLETECELNNNIHTHIYICCCLILREISPECSLEGLMLKLKLQYFGHLMRRTDSF